MAAHIGLHTYRDHIHVHIYNNITYIYIYGVYVDSHSLGQLALASKSISYYLVLWDIMSLVCIAGYCPHFSFKNHLSSMETILVVYASDIKNELSWEYYKWRHMCATTLNFDGSPSGGLHILHTNAKLQNIISLNRVFQT